MNKRVKILCLFKLLQLFQDAILSDRVHISLLESDSYEAPSFLTCLCGGLLLDISRENIYISSGSVG